MVNEAILGALKSALTRGESLKKAMMTVFNAGYKREEISEAARLINEGGVSPQAQPVQPVSSKKEKKSKKVKMVSSKKSSSKEKKSKKADKKTPPEMPQQPQMRQQSKGFSQLQVTPEQVQDLVQQLPVAQQKVQPAPVGKNPVQKVSGYGEPPKPKSKTTIIILGFLLLFLIGGLVALFLFKEELLTFFNNLFN